MTTAVMIEVSVTPEGVAIWDRDARVYIVQRESQPGVHVVQPADPADARVRDGSLAPGSLVCSCPGGTYHGRCWAIEAVTRHEEATRWDDLVVVNR